MIAIMVGSVFVYWSRSDVVGVVLCCVCVSHICSFMFPLLFQNTQQKQLRKEEDLLLTHGLRAAVCPREGGVAAERRSQLSHTEPSQEER